MTMHLTAGRRALMKRLAREFVDEYLEGKPHRRAGVEQQPISEIARRRRAIAERRAFLAGRMGR